MAVATKSGLSSKAAVAAKSVSSNCQDGDHICHSKRLIASDGLDADRIVALHEYFNGRIRFSAGWGTLLTNDFRDCHPRGEDTFEPISLVCKLTSADGIPTVKLSDNPRKATGPADLIARYRRVFNSPVLAEEPVLV